MKITTADGKVAEGLEQELFEPIAVIGLGALMPDAKDVEAFWQNIKQGKVSIKDVKPKKMARENRRLLENRRPW